MMVMMMMMMTMVMVNDDDDDDDDDDDGDDVCFLPESHNNVKQCPPITLKTTAMLGPRDRERTATAAKAVSTHQRHCLSYWASWLTTRKHQRRHVS